MTLDTSVRLSKPAKHFFRGDGQLADAHAGGVVDGVGDGRGDGDKGRFTERFGAEGADGIGLFDQYRFDGRNVDEIGNFKGVEIQRQRRAGVGVHGDIFQQRVADALNDPADDLAARGFGVDDAARVVRRDVAQNTNGAGVRVDFDLGEMGGKRIDDMRLAAGAQFCFADNGLVRLAPDDVTHRDFDLRRIGDGDEAIAQCQSRRLDFEKFRGAFEQALLRVFRGLLRRQS